MSSGALRSRPYGYRMYNGSRRDGHSLKGDVDLMHYNAQNEEDLKRIYDRVMVEFQETKIKPETLISNAHIVLKETVNSE